MTSFEIGKFAENSCLLMYLPMRLFNQEFGVQVIWTGRKGKITHFTQRFPALGVKD